jgi:hypothetical protein
MKKNEHLHGPPQEAPSGEGCPDMSSCQPLEGVTQWTPAVHADAREGQQRPLHAQLGQDFDDTLPGQEAPTESTRRRRFRERLGQLVAIRSDDMSPNKKGRYADHLSAVDRQMMAAFQKKGLRAFRVLRSGEASPTVVRSTAEARIRPARARRRS